MITNDLNKFPEKYNPKDLQILSFTKKQNFEEWLEQNYTLEEGIWLRFYKKNSGIKTIIYTEALDIALCYGWIDGQVKKYDENSYIQKFTHRRAKSMWSKRNKERVEYLEKECKLKPSGIIEIEKAKADGRWERAYDSPSYMIMPEDFMRELSKNKKAFDFFESLNKTNKYTIGWRLQTAKNLDARVKLMGKILLMMENQKKFH
ncbi:MAG: YdeI/OmpD-associated family protein [Paludibacter sp.]|nr:YdeI/OmpD-associated family protein [Paludibacter sp.]